MITTYNAHGLTAEPTSRLRATEVTPKPRRRVNYLKLLTGFTSLAIVGLGFKV